MGLHLSPFSFAHCSHNLGSTVPAAVPGNNVTLGNNNTKGSVASLIAALTHDVHYIVIGFAGANTSGGRGHALYDLLVDPAGGTAWGTTNPLAPNLMAGYTPACAAGTIGVQEWFHLPLYVKAGSSLGARGQSAHTLGIVSSCVIYAYGEPSRPDSWWCGSHVETLGVDVTASKGSVDITPGSGAWGSWTDLTGAITTARWGAIQMGTSGVGTSANATNYHYQLGYGGQRIPGTPTWHSAYDTLEKASRNGHSMPVFCDIPEGTQFQGRSWAGGVGQLHGMSVHGVAA